jgi:hypothetical protein
MKWFWEDIVSCSANSMRKDWSANGTVEMAVKYRQLNNCQIKTIVRAVKSKQSRLECKIMTGEHDVKSKQLS